MPIIRVPRPFRPSLEELLELPDGAFAAIDEALQGMPDYSATSDLVGAVRAAAEKSGQGVGSQALVQTLIALRSQIGLHGRAADEESDIAALATDLAGSGDLNIAEDGRKLFAERIRSLIGHSSIATTSAAIDLIGEDERIYGDARTLTDIRPVFGGQPERPRAAIIVNTLKIDCFTTKGPEEFYVTLEVGDLEMLRQVLDRAIAKTETIREFLREAGIAEVPTDGPEEDEED